MASAVLTKYREVIFGDDDENSGYVIPYEYGPKLLNAQNAVAVLEQMLNEPLAIVGGDIWTVCGERYEIREDWFCERMPAESSSSFARRSMETAIARVNMASQYYGSSVLVDLVVKDAITGEPLRR